MSNASLGDDRLLPRLDIRGPLACGLAALAAVGLLVSAGIGIGVDRGVRMTGNLTAPGATSPVSHASGGTIAQVHVREGDVIAEGDLVVSLDKSELDAQIAGLVARAAEAKGQLAALMAEVRNLVDRIDEREQAYGAHLEAFNGRVRIMQREVAALEARIALAEQQLAQTEVRAGRGGRLVHLAGVAPGDVVSPGVVLAEIAPPEAPVGIETRISPALTGLVEPGAKAKAWLTGITRRELAPVEARVASVAPDGIADRRVGLAFHTVQVELALRRAELERRYTLHPGQRVEVLVPTGERSLAAHVLDPVLRNLDPVVRRRLWSPQS